MDQVLGSSSDDVLDPPVRGGRGITTRQRAAVDFTGTIPGWGSDLELQNRPGVPRDKAPELGNDGLYAAMQQQTPPFRIYKSTEHARLTPVFGTSCPPRGLSGMIRDFAYRFSEGRHTHWLLLIVADRIDVVEDFLNDLFHLRVPNIPKEMGLAAEMRYNRQRFLTGSAITLALVAGAVLWWRARSR